MKYDLTKNENWLKAQAKTKETCKRIKKENELKYLQNPKYCLCCNKILKYDKRIKKRKFCNIQCACFYNNTKNPSKYSNDIKNKIRDLYVNKGIGCRMISKELNIPNGFIYNFLTKNNLTRNHKESSEIKKKNKKWYDYSVKYEQRKKISENMKKAHAEGRHPGWSFMNVKKRRSYPEGYIFKVLKNAGFFKKYTIEEKFPFSKYFLDFAFIDIKLDLEVDGEQHYITKEAIEHDKRRNEYVKSKGWAVYRICWSNFLKNKKEEIKELFDFIENIDNNTERYYNIEEVSNKKDKRKYGKIKDYLRAIKKINEIKNKPKIEKILNSDIDFSKFGWVSKSSKILEIYPEKVSRWMKRYMKNFYEEKCFKRKICSRISTGQKI